MSKVLMSEMPLGDGFEMYYTSDLKSMIGLPNTTFWAYPEYHVNEPAPTVYWQDALVFRKTDDKHEPPDNGSSGIAFTMKPIGKPERLIMGIRGYGVQIGLPPQHDAKAKLIVTNAGHGDAGKALMVIGNGDWAATALENRGTGQVLTLNNSGGSGDFLVAGSSSQAIRYSKDIKFAVRANGQTETRTLKILGGGDVAEGFDVSGVAPRPGMVVSIDPANEGSLAVSKTPYDRRVAGVISGAGGVSSGLVLSQPEAGIDGAHPVALSGRVHVWCDATNSPIAPGDQLTTSDRPGHCMKVTDHDLAPGAVIGKAMGSLDKDTGLVLTLVNLQ